MAEEVREDGVEGQEEATGTAEENRAVAGSEEAANEGAEGSEAAE